MSDLRLMGTTSSGALVPILVDPTGKVMVTPLPAVGDINSTDDVAEGTSNLYFTEARAADAAPVQTVNGQAGAVELFAEDLGLGQVDNTPDALKPISEDVAAALAAKVSRADRILTGSVLYLASFYT